MPCSCESPRMQPVVYYYDPRAFQLPTMPGQGGGGVMPMPMPGQGGGGVMPMPMPGQGGGGVFPMPPMPGQGGGGIMPMPMPGQGGGGVPAQLSPANLPSVLAQHPRPVGQPPAEMLLIYNYLRSNPRMLQAFIQQRPQSLQQAVQFAQFGTMGPRESVDRLLPGICYNRWSLIFTFNNVYLMFPVTNLFGFVIGYCHPLTPCIVPDFQILFAFC
ncbi:hypothetical protein [Paenibacillus sp. MMS18-CY102]|uniref:hypothetical protein n=1 Tax=Paenibacillus sp. MMS18-CY102 TaxID=2682849 RepID=UPI001365E866|nr:hypothetical protein [Paenibacillus sp. MMS18-CY102]MWC27104.1 hypothetical protein [Paenibacillus sp. MMS18-CY102]